MSSIHKMQGKDILNNPDIIIWGQAEITWKDFLGKKMQSGRYEAVTYAGISFAKDSSDWKIFSFFIKKYSRKNDTSEYLLAHEKYHFNVVEIFARKIRKDVIEKSISPDSTNQFNNYISKLWVEVEKMQRDYDNETNHSIDKIAQQNWQTKIDKKLDSLQAYKSIIAK